MKAVIDLKGPNGNSFALIATARQLAKKLGKTDSEIKEITSRMTSGDYENLLKVFEEEFGSLVELKR